MVEENILVRRVSVIVVFSVLLSFNIYALDEAEFDSTVEKLCEMGLDCSDEVNLSLNGDDLLFDDGINVSCNEVDCVENSIEDSVEDGDVDSDSLKQEYFALELREDERGNYFADFSSDLVYVILDVEVGDEVIVTNIDDEDKYRLSVYSESGDERVYLLEKYVSIQEEVVEEFKNESEIVSGVINKSIIKTKFHPIFYSFKFYMIVFLLFVPLIFALFDFSKKREERKKLYSIIFNKRSYKSYLNKKFDEKEAKKYVDMVNDIKNYLNKNEGESIEVLKNDLLEAGWNIDIINEVLRDRRVVICYISTNYLYLFSDNLYKMKFILFS